MMKEQIQQAGYVADAQSRVWSRPGYIGIPYSDGDEPEQRISDIVAKAKDLSPLSLDLARYCTDWTSRYHLSSVRANILRPFTALLRGDILEIGAGCGAITRFLGECGGRILAVEGSCRRAAIAAARTRDLDNVTVLAESFEQFEWPAQFDVITLIGVFEYADVFIHAESPPQAMLQRVCSLLKPDGVLIMAIENQLGLKYFAGAVEDHTGKPMYGIEGRYRTGQAHTFGRAALSDMLCKAGFGEVEFMLPFPDYKLPASVVTKAGLNSKSFDAAALAWQTVRRDPQLPPTCNFSLELSWPAIFSNGLALDMANSFLVAASRKTRQLIDPRVLAFHYSTGRQPAYCKEAVFESHGGDSVSIRYNRLARQGVDPVSDGNCSLRFNCPDTAEYSNGSPMSLEFVRLVSTDGWTVSQVAGYVRRYLEVLRSISREKGAEIDVLDPHCRLDGALLDAVPSNLIIRPSGQVALIDEEWTQAEPLELGYLLFRAMMTQMWMVSRFGANGDGEQFSHGSFMVSVFDSAGIRFKGDDFQRYVDKEAMLHNHVAGYASFRTEDANAWLKQSLKTATLPEQLAKCEDDLARVTVRAMALEQSLAMWRGSLFGRMARAAHYGLEVARLPVRAGRYLANPVLRERAVNNIGRRWTLLRRGRRIEDLPGLEWLLHKLEIDVPVKDVTAWLGAYLTPADEARYRATVGPLRAAGSCAESSRVRRTMDLLPPAETLPRRRRILFVCGEFPNPVHGGGGRVADFVKALSVHNDVFVAAWYDQRRDHDAFVDLKPYCRGLLGLKFEDLEGGCHGKLMDLLGDQPADVVHYEWPRSLISLDRRLGRHHIYTHMESVSCSLWMDLHRLDPLSRDWPKRLAQLLTMLGVEALDAGRADAQIVVTAKDGEFLSRFVTGQTYYVVNHGINRDEFDVPEAVSQPNTLVFTGNFMHYPNVDAVQHFMDKIRPAILSSVPDLRVWLVGANPPREVRRYHDGHHVMVTGRVPDVRPYIQRATVCIAPLISGAGLRTKVVQYAALRRPCVATPIAAEDLGFENGREVWVAADAAVFAARVTELLLDPARAVQMAERARTKAMACYDNRLIAERGLGNLYRVLDGGKG